MFFSRFKVKRGVKYELKLVSRSLLFNYLELTNPIGRTISVVVRSDGENVLRYIKRIDVSMLNVERLETYSCHRTLRKLAMQKYLHGLGILSECMILILCVHGRIDVHLLIVLDVGCPCSFGVK